MTTVPIPGFLYTEALDEFRKFDGPLIYLAAPLGHPDPSIRHERFESVNNYCGYLIRQRVLVFSPLSLGASLDENAISNSAWYALGLQMLARCDELRILALDGWEESVGVSLETRYARQLSIPVSVADPLTYEVKMLHGN
ncbi:MAG: DUF1937 family protein [Chloroflexota bacterium]|nr:DUF1937 family protein [Chloroflexota bacterium]